MKRNRRPSNTVVILTALCFAFALSSVMLWATLRHRRAAEMQIRDLAEDTFIWGDFTASRIPTTLVFSDVFTFRVFDSNTGQSRLLYDERTDSIEKLRLLLSSETGDVRGEEAHLLPCKNLWDLHRIYPIFTQMNKTPRLQLASRLNPGLIRSSNIIYIGRYGGMRELEPFFPRHPVSVEIGFGGPRLYDASDSVSYSPGREGDRINDYVLLAKMPGPKNVTILYIVSFSELGSHEMVRQISRPTSLDELKNRINSRFGEIPAYYLLIMRVQGFEHTVVHSELLALHSLAFDQVP